MLSCGLDTSLSRVREETPRNTKQHLGADNPTVGRSARASAVMDEQTKRDHEKAGSEENEGLESADFENHQTQ